MQNIDKKTRKLSMVDSKQSLIQVDCVFGIHCVKHIHSGDERLMIEAKNYKIDELEATSILHNRRKQGYRTGRKNVLHGQ